LRDARFVRFQNDDGSFAYYATYTAYDGKMILPQLLETPNFLHSQFNTLKRFPPCRTRALALFPRKNQRPLHHALAPGRREHFDQCSPITFIFGPSRNCCCLPRNHGNLFKLGNCGSPIETERGWLVLSHVSAPCASIASARFC